VPRTSSRAGGPPERCGLPNGHLAADARHDKGENAEAAIAITRAIERTNAWPEADLFDRFR
jgi:hypothetical protein